MCEFRERKRWRNITFDNYVGMRMFLFYDHTTNRGVVSWVDSVHNLSLNGVSWDCDTLESRSVVLPKLWSGTNLKCVSKNSGVPQSRVRVGHCSLVPGTEPGNSYRGHFVRSRLMILTRDETQKHKNEKLQSRPWWFSIVLTDFKDLLK